MIPDHTQREHSPLGASGAHRWMNCPGSYTLCKDLPSESSTYANEGTAAHELLEWCLRYGKEPIEYPEPEITVKGESFPVDDEMCDAVGLAVDTAREMIEAGDEALLEHRFHLKELHDLLYGTVDFALYKPAKRRLIVLDYKHGSGVAVDVDCNPQLMYYSIGAALELQDRPIDHVELYVVQPRCPHPGGQVRRYEFPIVDLVDFAGDLVAAAESALDPHAPRIPGDHCRFCPGRAICPEKRQSVLDIARADFTENGEIILPEPSTMDKEFRAAVLRESTAIRDWFNAVQSFEHQRALEGDMPTGFKLVRGRSVRRWRNEETLADDLMVLGAAENDIYERKLRSPAKVEKLPVFKKQKDLLEDLIEKPDGKLQLVPEDDPREPVKPEAAEQFEVSV